MNNSNEYDDSAPKRFELPEETVRLIKDSIAAMDLSGIRKQLEESIEKPNMVAKGVEIAIRDANQKAFSGINTTDLFSTSFSDMNKSINEITRRSMEPFLQNFPLWSSHLLILLLSLFNRKRTSTSGYQQLSYSGF